jgi:hypothetical protein
MNAFSCLQTMSCISTVERTKVTIQIIKTSYFLFPVANHSCSKFCILVFSAPKTVQMEPLRIKAMECKHRVAMYFLHTSLHAALCVPWYSILTLIFSSLRLGMNRDFIDYIILYYIIYTTHTHTHMISCAIRYWTLGPISVSKRNWQVSFQNQERHILTVSCEVIHVSYVTNSMVRSIPWKADRNSVEQDTRRILSTGTKLCVILRKPTDVSEEHIATIFRVEK